MEVAGSLGEPSEQPDDLVHDPGDRDHDMLTYTDFFRHVMALPAQRGPYGYQERLALEPWPEFLDVPTGLGKTAGVTLAWLYKRLNADPATPRRLIWCLPMRVLVEQTRAAMDEWLERALPLFHEAGQPLPVAYTLMGGEAEDGWAERPEDPAVVVGTQDMLLSRALMRGYGLNRYRWPMHFAVLHNDALWVYDEVQLMGPGLATSAQLEGFRRNSTMPLAKPSHSLWISATLRPDWLNTVDFSQHADRAQRARLTEADMSDVAVRQRLSAPKSLHRAPVALEGSKKADVSAYINELAELVVSTHDGSGPTLVIVNTVDRAQALYRAVEKATERTPVENLLLVHARFRQTERDALNRRIQRVRPDEGLIVIATQAVEAGVDLTSRLLFTELAPWASLVQRFGRCNRGGEYNDATVYWLDMDTAEDPKLAPPYEPDTLDAARLTLERLSSATSAGLPAIEEKASDGLVLRRRDFIGLFDTDPDLSGFDVDVAPYIRDSGQPQLQVFWRDFHEQPNDEPEPTRAELCPVSMSQITDHLAKKDTPAWAWDVLGRRWQRIQQREVRPGQTLLLRRTDGGYSDELGFLPRHLDKRTPICVLEPGTKQPEANEDDDGSLAGRFIDLTEHLVRVTSKAGALCETLGEPEEYARPVILAAAYHDTGKAHPAFQNALLAQFDEDDVDPARQWAKSPGRGRLIYQAPGEPRPRRQFRHELASALLWLEHGTRGDDHDLTAYLIAAHHGKVRLGIRALPEETAPPEPDRLYARGVWEGDTLPAVQLPTGAVPETQIGLDVMKLGTGPNGDSWTARTRRLLTGLGPFRLAWLETLVRLADGRASAEEVVQNVPAAPALDAVYTDYLRQTLGVRT